MTNNYFGANLLNTNSDLPLYRQLENALVARITSGQWGPGTKIPSEPELCEIFDVSRITVRNALSSLVQRNMLVRERGKGTFVRDVEVVAEARSVHSFTTEMRNMGIKPGSRILSVETVPASQEVARALELSEGSDVVQIERLRTGDGRPIAIQTTHLVASMFPNIAQKLRDNSSLYTVLNQEYNIKPLEATEIFRAISLPAKWAKKLGVSRGKPAFSVTRTTFAQRGVFEYTHSILCGDRYHVQLSLKNP